MEEHQLHDEGYDELIIRYLDGYATEEEKRQLQSWIKASSANREAFEEMKQIWQGAGETGILHAIDLEADWAIVKKQMQPKIKTLSSSRFGFWRAIAAGLTLLLVASLVYIYQPRSSDRVVEVTLNDGTRVWLADGSKLNYPDQFSDGQRSVELKGKAFFEVKIDAGRPFVINSGETEIKVLGTSFNVIARDDRTEVTVKTGRVQMQQKGNSSKVIELTPNERGVSDSNGLSEAINPNPNYLSWKTNVFSYNGVPIETVVQEIAAHYQQKITLMPGFKPDCSLVATFDNETLNTILTTIENTCRVQIKKQASGYIIGDWDGTE